MHFGGFILNLPSRQGSRPTSWSTALSYCTCRHDVGVPAVDQYDEGISEDYRRVDIDGLEEARRATLVQSARSSRASDATMIGTSRNTPLTLPT
jgi:hypothetical protein